MDSIVNLRSPAEHQRRGVVVKGKQIRIFRGGTVIDRHSVEALVIELDDHDASTVGPQLRPLRRCGFVTDFDNVVLQHRSVEAHLYRQRATVLCSERIGTRYQFEAMTDYPIETVTGSSNVKQRLAELQVMRGIDRIGEPFLRRSNSPILSVVDVEAI